MEKGSSSSSSSGDGLKYSNSESVAPSPAKKGRSGVMQAPRCQVEGCRVDLSDAKSYYSRHKVCSMHSKYPKVVVAGIEQRFCQQCSRFHQLPEFDQGKRSCRRRLAGHNERRRKPPPGPLLSSSYTTTLTVDTDGKTGGSGRDSWPNSSTEYEPQLPWQSSSQTHLLQGPSAQASYSSPAEDCFKEGSSSRGALSLLSNAHNFSDEIDTAAQFPCSWDFKANQDNSSLHDMPPHMGFSQGQGSDRLDNGQYQEFEASDDYESSVQRMKWSL